MTVGTCAPYLRNEGTDEEPDWVINSPTWDGLTNGGSLSAWILRRHRPPRQTSAAPARWPTSSSSMTPCALGCFLVSSTASKTAMLGGYQRFGPSVSNSWNTSGRRTLTRWDCRIRIAHSSDSHTLKRLKELASARFLLPAPTLSPAAGPGKTPGPIPQSRELSNSGPSGLVLRPPD